jgi:hypothetical protein
MALEEKAISQRYGIINQWRQWRNGIENQNGNGESMASKANGNGMA